MRLEILRKLLPFRRARCTEPWDRQVRWLRELPLDGALQALERRARETAPDEALQRFGREWLGLEGRKLRRWLPGAWWGRASHAAVRLRAVDGRDAEVRSLLFPMDLAPLRDLQAKGRGVILAGAHLGPGRLARIALAVEGIPALLLARDRRFRTDGRGEEASTDPSFLRRALSAAFFRLREGGVVYGSPDGRQGSGFVEAACLGRKVSLHPGIASLAQLSGSPCLPVIASWEGRRVRIRFGEPIEAPPGRDGAGGEAVRRWMEAYLRWLEGWLQGPPENLRFRGGLWNPAEGGFL